MSLTSDEISLILNTTEFLVSATRTQHVVPTIALRIVSKKTDRVVAYSSDTEKCDAVVELSRGAHLLLHEATTLDRATVGHSSARQAGSQAQHASVKTLVLVHLPPDCTDQKLSAAAAKNFDGKVVVGKDFQRFGF